MISPCKQDPTKECTYTITDMNNPWSCCEVRRKAKQLSEWMQHEIKTKGKAVIKESDLGPGVILK